MSAAHFSLLQRAWASLDCHEQGHALRTADQIVALAARLGLDEAAMLHLRRGAMLHDIGKAFVPPEILNKPGPLTHEETAVMRCHPVVGYKLLVPIPYLRPASPIPLFHHERWDGSGYPCQLKGDDIPLAARLFAVVDVWDALLDGRSYHAAWPEAKAREYLLAQAGIQFDAAIVKVFLEKRDNGPLPVTQALEPE